jgi:hypothetical protein
MSQEIDYTKVLADLEARRAAIDTMITGVKVLLGQSPPEAASTSSAGTSPPAANDLPKEVTPGVFHGMSVSEATRTFLEMRKTKQRVKVICEALTRGGIESDSKNFYGNVYTVLQRNPNVFAQRGKAWGLTGWYKTLPTGTGAKATKKGRRAKKSRKRSMIPSDKQKVLSMATGTEKAETA